MEAYGGPAQPSPTIAQCLNGGLGWLEVECKRCRSMQTGARVQRDNEAATSSSSVTVVLMHQNKRLSMR
jgi:hypothetical protein